jgi:hypothetical protein
MADNEIPDFPGAEELARRFGRWPDFHDWEVLEILLSRDGPSHIVLQSPPEPSHIVTFELRDITDLELADFSVQNVVGAVWFERKDNAWRLNLSPIFGIAGYIAAATISILSAT